MKRLIVLLCLVLFVPATVYSQSPFKNCAAEGRAKKTKKNPTGKISENTKAQNRLKNRDDGPDPSDIDKTITIEDLLKKSNDKKFAPGQGVVITGYVADVTPGGKQESCNCGRTDLQDIHIAVVSKPSFATNKKKHLVVEISPKFQADLGNYKKVRKDLKGQWVKFTGWLFYDSIHKQNAVNNNGKGTLWRQTVWEVHPVSAWEIVSEP